MRHVESINLITGWSVVRAKWLGDIGHRPRQIPDAGNAPIDSWNRACAQGFVDIRRTFFSFLYHAATKSQELLAGELLLIEADDLLLGKGGLKARVDH